MDKKKESKYLPNLKYFLNGYGYYLYLQLSLSTTYFVRAKLKKKVIENKKWSQNDGTDWNPASWVTNLNLETTTCAETEGKIADEESWRIDIKSYE